MGSDWDPTTYRNNWVRSFKFRPKMQYLIESEDELDLLKFQAKMQYLIRSEEEPTKYCNLWVSSLFQPKMQYLFGSEEEPTKYCKLWVSSF